MQIKSLFSRLAAKDRSSDTPESELLDDYENAEGENAVNDAVESIVITQRNKKK